MRNLFVLLGGLLFGFGLALSGMARPEVVLSFLHLQDLGLLLVMGGAILATMAAYELGPRLLRRPALGAFERYRAALSPRTIVGAALFGLGWGISGLCPGSALASVGIGNYPILIGLAGMFLGAFVQGWLFDDRDGATEGGRSHD